MATRTAVFVVDDIDGSDDAETVTFSYDSKPYEIDLSPANRTALEAALEPFISAARTPAGATRAKVSPRMRVSSNLSAVREWAAENGHDGSARAACPRR